MRNNVKEIYSSVNKVQYSIFFANSSVNAGFPSPAEDSLDKRLDLNKELIKTPSATFFIRVSGDSMSGVGIQDNDLLVVDRSLEARNGNIIIASINNEFTVKRFIQENNKVILRPENVNYKELVITESMNFQVWGVVTCVIRKY